MRSPSEARWRERLLSEAVGTSRECASRPAASAGDQQSSWARSPAGERGELTGGRLGSAVELLKCGGAAERSGES